MRAIRYDVYLWKPAPVRGCWRKNRRFGISVMSRDIVLILD